MWAEYRGVVKKGTKLGIVGERWIQVIIDWPYVCNYEEDTGVFNLRLEGLQQTFQLQFRGIHKANKVFFEERVDLIIAQIANEEDPKIVSKVNSCGYCRYSY